MPLISTHPLLIQALSKFPIIIVPRWHGAMQEGISTLALFFEYTLDSWKVDFASKLRTLYYC